MRRPKGFWMPDEELELQWSPGRNPGCGQAIRRKASPTVALQWSPGRNPGCGVKASTGWHNPKASFNGAQVETRDAVLNEEGRVVALQSFNGAQVETRDAEGFNIGICDDLIKLQWSPGRNPGCGTASGGGLGISVSSFNGAQVETRDAAWLCRCSRPRSTPCFNGAQVETRDADHLVALHQCRCIKASMEPR